MLWDKGVLPLPVRLNDRNAGPLKTLYEGIGQAVVDRKVEHRPGHDGDPVALLQDSRVLARRPPPHPPPDP